MSDQVHKIDKMDDVEFTGEALKKPDQDFTPQTDEILAKSTDVVAKGGKAKLQEALDSLFALEKQTRLGGDGPNTSRILVQIVKLCAQTGSWKELNDSLAVITKKRAQIKLAIAKMVQEAMNWIDQTPSKEVKIELINTLKTITEGKIFVEVERARIVRMLAKIREAEGNIKEAAGLLQEVQIETVGSMEAREKIDFILEQMRLTLDKGDYVRAQIISRKITARSLADKSHQDLKIRFYKLMLRYYTHKKDFLEMYRSYHQIFDTPSTQEDQAQWINAVEHMVIYLVLAPFDNHQSDAMNRLWLEKKLEDKAVAPFRELLRNFVNDEVISWPDFVQQFMPFLSKHKVFVEDPSKQEELQNRVVEKNIRIIAKYYSRIHNARLAQLLHLDEAKTESFISKMVTSKTISAKIDRIDGIVTFKRPQETSDVLNDWSADIVQLLRIVENTVHLINKENMINAPATAKKAAAK